MCDTLIMDGLDFVKVKRGRTGSKPDMDVIKIKRSETPEDIASALLKEEGGNNKDDNSENDYDMSDDDSHSKEDDKASEDALYEKEENSSPREMRRHVSHGYHLVEGKMNHGMEDYLVAKHKKIDGGRELGLYAIFDGHSGHAVAEYLKSHLFESILNEPDFWTNPRKAVKRAYEDTDNDILENVVGSRGGSTAVTAILINSEKLVVANVGDSRAVLCKNGTAKQVTVDHDPLKEKELVESRGGFVSKKPGNVPRVDGQLNLTRAFGDERRKKHITSEPDIVIKKIDEDIEFMILASDGLWKVMSNQEAVDCIRGSKDGREAAEELIKEAILRESKDDISCVVVIFHDD